MSVYIPTIGIEIHVQLNTSTKLFCDCSTKFGDRDNQNICPVCLGLPGSLPVINHNVVQKAILAGKMLNCKINTRSVFERKNYFYPDLPKGYQISQYKEPICEKGSIEFYSNDILNKVHITRVHIEEDAGKLIHQGESSVLNFNRAGIPLLEIVSEPEIQSPKHASDYARAIKDLVVYIGISDGNLEEGSLRCDCNISLRKKNEPLGTKVELKNLNSFRFIEKALEYEIARQNQVLDLKSEITQETRLYDSATNKTTSMRSKEDSEDYKYFPDPDLSPIELSKKDLIINIPEPQIDKIKKLSQYMPTTEAIQIAKTPDLADHSLELFKNYNNIDWIKDYLYTIAKKHDTYNNIKALRKIIDCVDKKEISIRSAKLILEKSSLNNADIGNLIEQKKQLSDDTEILNIVKNIIEENNNQWKEYLKGNAKIREFFVGKVMSKTKGKANPNIVIKIIEKLKSK